MTKNPLFSCRVKVDRAYKHFRDFQQAIEAFGSRNKDSVFTDEETEPGVKIDRFVLKEKIPTDFSSYVGDIAHNLMSALDSLAMSLVLHYAIAPVPEDILSKIYFPVGWKADVLNGDKAKRLFELTSSKVEQIVRFTEPHKGGRGDNLFRLWLLNLTDKHRAIVTVAADLAGIVYSFPTGFPPPPPTKRPPGLGVPLKDGDILNRRVFNQDEYYANAQFHFQIAFGETQVFQGEPVLPTLEQMIHAVEGTIYTFVDDIFGETSF